MTATPDAPKFLEVICPKCLRKSKTPTAATTIETLRIVCLNCEHPWWTKNPAYQPPVIPNEDGLPKRPRGLA